MKKTNRKLAFIVLIVILIMVILQIYFSISDHMKPKEAETATFTIQPHNPTIRYVIRQGSEQDTIIADRMTSYVGANRGYYNFWVDEQCVGVFHYFDRIGIYPVITIVP